MIRFTRQSTAVLVAVAGLALLAVAGAAVARSASAPRAAQPGVPTQTALESLRHAKPAYAQPTHAKPTRVKPTHVKPTKHKRPARSPFAIAADRICSANRATVRHIGAVATTWGLQQSELHDLVQATNSSLSRLEQLPAPKNASLARRYFSLTTTSIQDFVAAQQRSASTNESAGVAAERQDTSAAETSGHDAIAAQAAARTLGLRICGSPGAEWL